MSCDFNNPDNIDMGSLAIGASVKANYNDWNQSGQLNNPLLHSGDIRGVLPFCGNSKPFESTPDMSKPQFSPPIPSPHDSASFGQKSPGGMGMPSNSPNSFSPQISGSFSTMAALGLLSDKTIEKFFPRTKPQPSGPNTGYAPCNFYENRSSPVTTSPGISSSHCRYPSDSSIPLTSPQQMSPNYLQPVAANNHAYTYAPASQVPSPPGTWTNNFSNGQDPMQHRLPQVKMEWNGYPDRAMPANNGQALGSYYRQSKISDVLVH